MKFGVLGTGQVGSAIGGKLAKLGHDVVIGSRTPESAKARELARATGAPVASYAEAAAYGEWVFNALPGEPSVGFLRGCDIAGKILVDIANYNSAVDQPIALPVGEAIQQAFPEVRVVKALNSVSAHLMVDPADLGERHTVFLAGNDADAKRQVTELLRSFGWEDVLDLGNISASRAMEQLIPLWMRLEQLFGGPGFNLSVLRGETSLHAS
jgi:8-hydroxy-5-deazaflavin:NADPH oxidoreductase